MPQCRVIGLIDVDSFEVQVYQQLQEWEETKGHPCIVAVDGTDRYEKAVRLLDVFYG
jgi:hypothetical protein